MKDGQTFYVACFIPARTDLYVYRNLGDEPEISFAVYEGECGASRGYRSAEPLGICTVDIDVGEYVHIKGGQIIRQRLGLRNGTYGYSDEVIGVVWHYPDYLPDVPMPPTHCYERDDDDDDDDGWADDDVDLDEGE